MSQGKVVDVSVSADESSVQFNGKSETKAVVSALSAKTPNSPIVPGSDSSVIPPSATGPPSLPNLKYLFRPNDQDITVRIENAAHFKCTVCAGIYKQKFRLKRHFLRCHVNTLYISKADISTCKISVAGDDDSAVSKTANGRKVFKSGNAIFLANNLCRVMPGLYKCHMCVDVSFDMEDELRCHYNGHAANKSKFPCHYSDKLFNDKQLVYRQLSKHGENNFKKKCKRCDLEFSSKAEYQNHLSSHPDARTCEYCHKTLSSPANRKRHEDLHLGLKPYSCVHCEVDFAQKSDLDRHFRTRHKLEFQRFQKSRKLMV